ncbi:MAG TPA: M20/M25/M40 family metallo-hydrolase [Rhodopila sp.]
MRHRKGVRFAGAAVFDITVTGEGTHGARPQAGIDPVIVACQLGTAPQSIVYRNISVHDTAVLSVTRIASGDAYNVIPNGALMAGSVRTMQPEVAAKIERGIQCLAAGIAAAFGAEVSVDFRTLFAPVVKDEQEFMACAAAAARVVGEANLQRDVPPAMASEDFSAMPEQVPGSPILLANGDTAAVHNHLYDFNDEAMSCGGALLAAIAERKLPPGM